jgi:hypothetical protein
VPDAGTTCVDEDGDGRGPGCAQADCDDTDPAQTGEEVCDTRDNDCDANIDEGTFSECGDCNPLCHVGEHGVETEQPFDLANPNEGVRLEPDGALSLMPMVRREPEPYIWISNTGEGTISKVHTRDFVEVARYLTGPMGAANDPSRTSVDTAGNAYVGNRNSDSVTKIYVGGEEGCPDTNGDGRITTSSGGTDVLAWGQDDCVAWNRPLPGAGGVRGVAAQDLIGPDGEVQTVVWIGATGSPIAWKIDSVTGEIIHTAPVPVSPYGFAMDGMGNLWMTTGSQLGRINTNICVDEATCAGAPCPETDDTCPTQLINLPGFTYGISVDSSQRVWLGGSPVQRYDPSAPVGARVVSSTSHSFVHGIAADTRGNVWGAAQGEGLLRIDQEDPTRFAFVPASLGMSVKGVAVDGDGKVWGINMNGRFDFTTGDAIVAVPRAAIDEFTVWTDVVPVLVSPYTYSDMTGQQLRNVQTLRGTYNFTLDTCAPNMDEHVEYGEFRYEATVPESSLIEFFARTADTREALADATFQRIGESTMPSPLDLDAALAAAGVSEAQFIEFQVRMRAAGTRPESPVLRNIEVVYVCPDGLM